jgi:hypothetical protein
MLMRWSRCDEVHADCRLTDSFVLLVLGHTQIVDVRCERVQARKHISRVLKNNVHAPLDLADLFHEHSDLVCTDTHSLVQEVQNSDIPSCLEAAQRLLERIESKARAAQTLCPNLVRTGLYMCVAWSSLIVTCKESRHVQARCAAVQNISDDTQT